jgi:hypothetical protein
MSYVREIPTPCALCGANAFQHFIARRCILCAVFLVSSACPHRQYLLVAVMPLGHWSELSTPKSSRCPPLPKIQSIKVRRSWRPVECASTKLWSVPWKSGSGDVWQYAENELLPPHAWSIRLVVDEEAHVPRLLANHSQENDDTVYLSVSEVSPKCYRLRCSPRHWWKNRGLAMVVWGLLYTQACAFTGVCSTRYRPLWVPVSSVNRTSATNCAYSVFVTTHRQNTALARWLEVGGYHSLDNSWRILQEVGISITSSICNCLHTGSGLCSHSSRYSSFLITRPYISRHWFLGIWWRLLAHLN